MFLHASPRGPGVEVSQGSQASVDAASLPPPPPRSSSNGPGQARHDRNRRPPALNTQLAFVPGPPSSAPLVPPTPSSLSSPFSLSVPNTAHAITPAAAAPGTSSRGVSPANHRLSGNFTMTYNPQEWAAGRQSVEGRQRRDCYGEPLHTPPPPYSGSQDQRNSGSSAFSRTTTTYTSPDASLNTTPLTQDFNVQSESNNARPKPPAINTTSRQAYDMRRATHMNSIGSQEYNPAQPYQQYRPQAAGAQSSSLSFQPQRTSTDGANLPPPPPRRTPSIPPPENDQALPALRLEHTKRSTSAGPTPTAGPSTTRTLRTLSNEQPNTAWSQTTVLPGPPSAPLPSAVRSRSVDAQFDPTADNNASRSRPTRLALRNSNLTPIPATPNSVTSATSTRPMPFPLRIDTGIASGPGKAPAVVATMRPHENASNRNSQAGPSALGRRTAVRGSAGRVSGMLRSRSKSISGKSEAEPPSTTMSNNPWASALEQARSPQDETLPESSVLPRMDQPNLSDKRPFGRSHTPPATPSSQLHKSLNFPTQGTQQHKVLPTPPLSQKPLLSANSTADQDINFEDGQDDFASQAMQRHLDFLRKEQQAQTDIEKLNLFTQFMQQESLIRKEKYMTAFQSDDFDIEGAKDGLFNGSKQRRASARENVRLQHESPTLAQAPPATRADGSWVKEYHPQLSPIASMEYDEMSSRGRAPSRWWESATGSQSDGQGHGVHRSKRESKYMSLSKKLLQDMESGDMDPLYEEAPWQHNQQYPNEKANPDTFGFYDEEVISPPGQQQSTPRRALRPSALDISRFITLPPPYPRHYPAVNNNHPDLSEYRTTVRMLSELSEVKNRQSRHQLSIEAMRQDRLSKIAEIKKSFKASIQAQLADGSMSYAEAAETEKLVKAEEHELERKGLQNEFDSLQDVVINPLHDQLNERIEHLNNSLQSLQSELLAIAANQDPDQPVQEGDDVPELLEQLTQLKWLFEARESIHQELFGLLSQRNDAYKAIVALPYKQTNNVDKVRDTEAFFDKDAATRYASFCAESLKRHESFLQFVEDNALRGIEMQSSAFWDITPGLVDLLQKIPVEADKLDIDIPDSEMSESPQYAEHPQQYLYLLLRHAQQSSYQYIEGQVNLYCLVHEVKTSSLAAHYKASRAQQKMAGDESIDLGDTRLEDEVELTDELKNRAAMIEEQWFDALGKHFEIVQERVKQQLQDRGAWDEVATED